jgi:hypothetical protein
MDAGLLKGPATVLAILLTLALVAACQTRADIESVKSATYNGRMPQRILFGADIGVGFPGLRGEILGGIVEDTLKACNVNSAFQIVGGLTLRDPIADKIKQFGPDAIATIQWTKATTGYARGTAWYRIEMQDVLTKAVVWKADVTVDGADGVIGPEAPKIFATSLINRMKVDGLIPSNCRVV